MRRAFEIDWSRCNTERFRNFVRREDDASGDGELDAELAELKTALKEKCGLIYSVYAYYCAIGATADRYAMGLPEYHMLLHDLDLAEPSSKGCKPADLDNIFISTNVEDATRGAPSREQKALNSANLDKALMRFEFLQAIVRLAIAKYLKGGGIKDASEAVEKLLEHDFGLLPAEARHDPEEFRTARLYMRDTHNILSKHEKNLRGIFEFYSLGDDQEGKTSAGRRLSLQEWECFMHDCHLYDSPHFTRNEAALCFVWSQPFVTDEVKRRLKLTHLTFVDFLEALARTCTFKPLPTDAELRACKAHSVPHFYQQGGSNLLKAIDWREEERAERGALGPSLNMLIDLMTDALDCNHDGVVTKAELKKSREAGIVAQKMNAQADKIHERKLRDEMLQEQKMEQRTRRLTKEGLLPA